MEPIKQTPFDTLSLQWSAAALSLTISQQYDAHQIILQGLKKMQKSEEREETLQTTMNLLASWGKILENLTWSLASVLLN